MLPRNAISVDDERKILLLPHTAQNPPSPNATKSKRRYRDRDRSPLPTQKAVSPLNVLSGTAVVSLVWISFVRCSVASSNQPIARAPRCRCYHHPWTWDVRLGIVNPNLEKNPLPLRP